MDMIELNIQNETSKLESVILGTAESSGPVPSLEDTYDPKSREFISRGEYPTEDDMVKELSAFRIVLEKYGVEVHRPEVLIDVNQIFSRDVSFVIGDSIVVSNTIEARQDETKGIRHILNAISPSKIIHPPDTVRIEGGDVMPWNGKLYVGYSEDEDFDKYKVSRTNSQGVQFLKEQFPQWEVHSFELKKSDTDPYANALHLDCCFQPIGDDQAIMYPGGFKNQEDVTLLTEMFGKQNIIEITAEEMYKMFSNVFSISKQVIVSENNFTRLNNELRRRGFTVEEIPFREISKQEGLLRCTTMPLKRMK